jgi:hypothetical protein
MVINIRATNLPKNAARLGEVGPYARITSSKDLGAAIFGWGRRTRAIAAGVGDRHPADKA